MKLAAWASYIVSVVSLVFMFVYMSKFLNAANSLADVIAWKPWLIIAGSFALGLSTFMSGCVSLAELCRMLAKRIGAVPPQTQQDRYSVADQIAVATALINPPAPNQALLKTAELHARDVEIK